jgi:predicted transcriptional regulator
LKSDEPPAALELEARKRLYDIVRQLAGAHFREIQRASGLSFGSASYHLAYLQKHHLIKEERDGNNIRYFPVDADIQDKKLLMLLRQRSVRTILLFIFSHEGCTHQEIVSSVQLSPSTTTWHLKKLLENSIIQATKKGKYTLYSLSIPKERIMKLLIAYKESFIDTLVDGLIELWEQP